MFDMSILLQKFVKSIGGILNSVESMEDLIEKVREITDLLGLDIVKGQVEYLDSEIKKNPQRKKDWRVERKDDEKSILTIMGLLSFKRTYYESKENGEFKYLLDDLLRVEHHQRLDKGFSDQLIDGASERSYEKTANETGREKVSRQTVKMHIHRLEEQNLTKEILSDEKRKVEYLYIDADEDHISLQNKKSAHQYLLYVYEGKNEVNNRKELTNPYFVTGNSGKKLFEEALEYIKNNYDMNIIKRIYIQGDGAWWIKNGVNIIPNSRYVLDKFHMCKYVNACTGQNMKLKSQLYDVLNRADYDEMDVVFNKILEAGEVQPEKVYQSFKYLYSHFDGIKIMVDMKENPLGCSAEGHVSHVLSHRLSSRPLSWSSKGANVIAKLRVYKKNNGTIREIRENKEYIEEIEQNCEKYRVKVEMQGKIMYDRYNNIEILKSGQKTQTYKILQYLRGIS